MNTKRLLMGQIALLSALVAAPVYASMRVPTVDDCMEKTGKTEDECKAFIEKISERRGSMGEGRGSWHGKGRPQIMPHDEKENDGDGDDKGGEKKMWKAVGNRSSEWAEKKKEHRGERYQHIQERTQKLIDYLKSKGADTTAVESSFTTFKSKVADVTTAYDAYISAFKTWEGDKTDAHKTTLDTARETLHSKVKDANTYYRETLFPALKALLQSVKK